MCNSSELLKLVNGHWSAWPIVHIPQVFSPLHCFQLWVPKMRQNLDASPVCIREDSFIIVFLKCLPFCNSGRVIHVFNKLGIWCFPIIRGKTFCLISETKRFSWFSYATLIGIKDFPCNYKTIENITRFIFIPNGWGFNCLK